MQKPHCKYDFYALPFLLSFFSLSFSLRQSWIIERTAEILPPSERKITSLQKYLYIYIYMKCVILWMESGDGTNFGVFRLIISKFDNENCWKNSLVDVEISFEKFIKRERERERKLIQKFCQIFNGKLTTNGLQMRFFWKKKKDFSYLYVGFRWKRQILFSNPSPKREGDKNNEEDRIVSVVPFPICFVHPTFDR